MANQEDIMVVNKQEKKAVGTDGAVQETNFRKEEKLETYQGLKYRLCGEPRCL